MNDHSNISSISGGTNHQQTKHENKIGPKKPKNEIKVIDFIAQQKEKTNDQKDFNSFEIKQNATISF